MPELPDLLHVLRVLRERLVGRAVTATRVKAPVIMRYAVRGDLGDLVGRRLSAIEREAHFLVFRFETLDLCVNPMLAGRFRLSPQDAKTEGTLGFALAFQDVELRYLDDKKMGKAYLTAPGDRASIPALPVHGVYVLSPELTVERLTALLKGRRDQVRVFLLDKNALDSLGNAYADEVLFAAGIHPKTWCRALKPADVQRLHAAIVGVVTDAVAEVESRNEPIDVKVRDFLMVRMKTECPRCGARLRKAGVRGMDAYFCPHCQPETREGLVDWRRIASEQE
jgi:formamidopyrimidine-DNA glycosylase